MNPTFITWYKSQQWLQWLRLVILKHNLVAFADGRYYDMIEEVE